jgi:hypothetical protein
VVELGILKKVVMLPVEPTLALKVVLVRLV